jgi:hypothetical protein
MQIAAASRDGRYTVEMVRLETGWWLRAREYGWFVCQVRSPDELAPWVPLAELEMTETARGS